MAHPISQNLNMTYISTHIEYVSEPNQWSVVGNTTPTPQVSVPILWPVINRTDKCAGVIRCFHPTIFSPRVKISSRYLQPPSFTIFSPTQSIKAMLGYISLMITGVLLLCFYTSEKKVAWHEAAIYFRVIKNMSHYNHPYCLVVCDCVYNATIYQPHTT